MEHNACQRQGGLTADGSQPFILSKGDTMGYISMAIMPLDGRAMVCRGDGWNQKLYGECVWWTKAQGRGKAYVCSVLGKVHDE